MNGTQSHSLAGWEMIGLLVLAVILYGGYRFAKAFFKALEKEFFLVLAWRFLSGAHLHGEKRTDAGWWTHGGSTRRHAYEQGTFIDRWEHKPRGHRMLWRLGVLSAVTGIIYGLIAEYLITVHALESLAVYGLIVAGFVIEAKIILRVHTRSIVKPIYKSLAGVLKMSPHAVRKMIHIDPENITDEGEVGWIGPIPDHVTPGPDQMTSAERIIDTHLPVDIELIDKLQESPRMLVIKSGIRPPIAVPWDDMVASMKAAKYGDIVIGRDKEKADFSANFIELEDANWGFSANPRRGKSNFLGLVAIQVLQQDPLAQVIVIDPKQGSLIPFLGSPDYRPGLSDKIRPLIPGVRMANDPFNPEAMWAEVSRLIKLLEKRRAEVALDPDKRFPVAALLLDELNHFQLITDSAWKKAVAENNRLPKDQREYMPNECPVWENIRLLLQSGRRYGIHVIAVAQDFRAEIIGGHGARNLFGLRGLGGFLPNQWKMFIGTSPIPEAQNGSGRWIFCQGEQRDWVQITFCDAERSFRAYDYANTDERQGWTDEPLDGDYASVPDRVQAALSSLSLPSRTDVPEQDTRLILIGLAAGAQHLEMKFATFEQARKRYMRDHGRPIPGEFKEGRQPAWYEEDLIAWRASLPGQQRKKKQEQEKKERHLQVVE